LRGFLRWRKSDSLFEPAKRKVWGVSMWFYEFTARGVRAGARCWALGNGKTVAADGRSGTWKAMERAGRSPREVAPPTEHEKGAWVEDWTRRRPWSVDRRVFNAGDVKVARTPSSPSRCRFCAPSLSSPRGPSLILSPAKLRRAHAAKPIVLTPSSAYFFHRFPTASSTLAPRAFAFVFTFESPRT
jgi:hypothetical protein